MNGIVVKIKRVYISVGHGGKDPGAISLVVHGAGRMKESKINLNVAFGVMRRLQSAGIIVMMSRTDDETFKSIADQLKEAKAFGADLILGIHHNAGGGDGWEVLHQPTVESERVADLIGRQFNSINKAHGKNPTYVSSRSLGLMKSKILTVLTEAFFLDSEDVREIDELKEQEAEANCIAYGVLQAAGLR